MAQKGTESEKVMDQGMGTVSEGGVKPVGMKSGTGSGTGSDHGTFQSSVNSSVTGGKDAEQVGGTPVSGGIGTSEDIGSDDADSWDADEPDGGELSDMENTGVLVYREKFISKERRQKYWAISSWGCCAGARFGCLSSRPMPEGTIFWTSCSTARTPWSFGESLTR